MLKFKLKKKTSPRRRLTARTTPEATAKRPSVFSYRASRSNAADNLGREKGKEEKRRPVRAQSRIKKVAKIIVLVGLVIVLVNSLVLSSTPKVELIGTNSTFRDPAVYQTAAAAAFASSKFNTNKITLNAGQIRESLMQAFPELADVSISLPVFGHQAVVHLEPSTSRLILHTPSGVFVIDDTGRAVATGTVAESLRQAGLPEVQDESRLEVEQGKIALPSTTVSYITEVAQQLHAKGLTISGLKLPGSASELHLTIDGVGYYVKFNTRGDARVAVGSFLALKKHLESQQKTPAEYVDVRLETRAYYK